MQYECDSCGQMGRFNQLSAPFRTYCPVCEEETTWSRAFEGEGVTF